MAISTLKDVYIDQLQDLYSANKQALEATQKLRDSAAQSELTSALKRGVAGIEDGLESVSKILRQHDAAPTGEFCKGMEGLVKEVHAHALNADFDNNDVRDTMIITQYQRMVHYALAGYGCVVAFAKRLKLDDDARALEECLDETYSGDQVMTKIAEQDVNAAAAA